VVLCCAPGLLRAGEKKPEPNAALVYWQAFAMLPRFEPGQFDALAAAEKGDLDDEARGLIDSVSRSLTIMHRASRMARADWGLPYEEDGINLLLPHVDRGRTLARLATLRARREFESGDVGRGCDDLLATLALARHLGQDGLLICFLVQHSIEEGAYNLFAKHLARWTPARHHELLARIEKLPAGGSIAEVFRTGDRLSVKWLLARLDAMKGDRPEVWKDKVVALLTEVNNEEGRARTIRKTLDGLKDDTPARFAAEVRKLSAAHEKMAKLADEPPEQAVIRFADLLDEVKKENPVASFLLVPTQVSMIWERAAANRVRVEMLRTAVAILDGKPVAKGDLEQREVEGGGFELRSKLKVKGRPLTMRFMR